MSSKQEKLAAARKRLKEFQGKSKELEISQQKAISDVSESKILKDGFYSNKSVIGSRPLFSSSENTGISPHQELQHIYSKPAVASQGETPTPSSKESHFSTPQSEYNNMKANLENDYRDRAHEEQKFENSVKVALIESTGKNDFDINCSNSVSINKKQVPLERDHGDSCRSFHENVNTSVTCTEAKDFIEKDIINGSLLNDTIISLQRELQSHAQTIAILVQQRNDAQIALSKTQSLLNKKSGEAEAMGEQIASLTSSISNLTQRLFEAETVIKKLNVEKEENLHRWYESRSLTDNFQTQLDKKEEEFEEMKRKYEEKSKDCQQLSTALQEAQAQLSFYQIQLQQYSNEGHSGLAIQLSEQQSECVSLKKKVEELEKKLEIEKAEKEESSQKFHIYAQQCNSQLSSLNSQLKSVKLEKENLSKENTILSRNLSELENSRENAPSKSSEAEIAELHDQVNALSEEKKKLNNHLKEKEEERARLEHEVGEKELELNKLFGAVKELSAENKRLANEMEIPKADERMLATMESDKIAAAKAVSQNQSLKKQVVELEQAFIKLSEEKLELTNQLAHERHVSAELQALLRNVEGRNDEHDQQHECNHGVKEVEPLINDSNEIEELRSIVRQLEDDKMELTARLNAYELNKRNDAKKKEEDCNENGEQCESTKLLLQQMKEKVRKTMNEIAVLDEEKEKLEHLVLQLQGETETIGEYITLYQKQRMLLRQRAQEKDSQLLQLSKDKEELKSKLAVLDELVQRLIAERETANISPGSKLPDLNSSIQIRDNTAGKIRALINEIGSTTLISNQSIIFEHCSCCSGRLMTI